MIEPLVFRPNTEAGGYMVDGDIRKILPLVRQAVELGADVIKADPTDDPQEYHRVIQAARVPVLVRGGGKANDLEVLKRTEQVIAQGRRRNCLWQEYYSAREPGWNDQGPFGHRPPRRQG